MSKKAKRLIKQQLTLKAVGKILLILLLIIAVFVLAAMFWYGKASAREDKIIIKDTNRLVYIPEGWELESERFSNGYGCFLGQCRTLERTYYQSKTEDDNAEDLSRKLYENNLTSFKNAPYSRNCDLNLQPFDKDKCYPYFANQDYELEIHTSSNKDDRFIILTMQIVK